MDPAKPKVADLLPGLVNEIERALRAEGMEDLASQVRELLMDRWRYDAQADGLYIHLTGQRPLNAVESNIIGVRYGESIPLDECQGMVVLDIDNFGRITGVELLDRKDICNRLENFASRRI